MAAREVSGRYRGRRQGFEVELRVDVDGPHPTHRLSADYHRISGSGREYAGSMRVDAPVVTVNDQHTTITGSAAFSLPARCRRVEVAIPRTPPEGTPAGATLLHVATRGAPGAAYECRFESASFRTVELEEAFEKGVKPFQEYDTSALPSHPPPRTLTHVRAFAEAGIEMLPTGPPTAIDTSIAGEDATWSDAELHAAMEEHFSRWGDRPRWAMWLLHAAAHDDELVDGLMFDQRGLQRQGCAVFYGRASGAEPEAIRRQLHTCVHEIGHGFNLPHCWQKSLTEPPLPSRPDAASWMNYPERFPGGEDAYWSAFPFRFDDAELVHLRHGFEPDVIMGGSPFSGGARRDRTPGWDAEDRWDPGLRLKLVVPPALIQEMPVTVCVELSATTRQDRPLAPILGPRPGTVDIAICRPSGRHFVFEPLLSHCRAKEMITLEAGGPPVRDWAFIHYGRNGFSFDDPGRYLVRARYAPPGGPVVLSDIQAIQVQPPTSRVDRHIAELIGGDEQVGTLMSLAGSEARTLRRGNDRLEEISSCYPNHPVGAVARLVRAASMARGFKRLAADGTLTVSRPRMEAAAALVADVIEQERLRPGANPIVSGFANSRPIEVGLATAKPEPALPSTRPGTGKSAGKGKGTGTGTGKQITAVPNLQKPSGTLPTKGRTRRTVRTATDQPNQEQAS